MRAEAGSGDRFVEEEVEQVHVEDAGFVERAVQHVVAARLQSEQSPAGHDRREESAAFDRGIETSIVDQRRPLAHSGAQGKALHPFRDFVLQREICICQISR